MSNRDNQNKRDAGQTQQKENRENSQQNQGPEGKPQVTPLESPYGGADAPPYFFWREGLTAG